MLRIRRLGLAVAGLIVASLLSGTGRMRERPVHAAQQTDQVVLGMTTVLSGPAADLGIGMREGVLAAIEEANRAGGIKGRTLRLVALDDGYEPARTGPNMRKLVEEEKVLAVVGNVGTPTAVVALPIVMESKTPFVGAFTGAGVLRKSPPDRYVINFRASYAEETAAMVDALIDQAGIRPEQVAFFTQRDAYGDAGYAGGVAALKRRGLKDDGRTAHGRYERNTVAVENGLAEILAAPEPARAVIMVGAYSPSAAFVRLARRNGLDAVFMNVSFVGATPLARELGNDGDGVIITQVVPSPEGDSTIAREFAAAAAALPTKDWERAPYGAMEGYAVGRMFCAALARADETPSREALVAALEGMGEFDLGLGAPLRLSATEHQACHAVWPTVIRSGRVVPMQWSELRTGTRAAADGGRP